MNFDQLETRETSSSARKMYTGFAPIQIMLVNPTRKELATFLNTEEEKVKEPNYLGEKSTRIDFWYTNHPTSKQEFRGKLSIFVDNNSRVSIRTNKKQWIDDFTKSAWAENLASLSEQQASLPVERRIDLRSIRECKGGEETIYSLLKAYGNLAPKTRPLVLSSWNSLVKGDGKELTDFFAHYNKDNGGVKVLLGIRDGKYQDVFTGIFLSVTSKITDYVSKIVTGDYGFKSFYNNSYTFNEYNEELAPTTSEVDANAPIMMFGDSTPEIKDPFGGSVSDGSMSSLF
jgi:hypothetical protein